MKTKRFDDWNILKSGKRSDFLMIAVVALLLLLVIWANVHLIFQMTSGQTDKIGQMQLERIENELTSRLRTAEGTTIRMGEEAQNLLLSSQPRSKIEEFVLERKKEQLASSGGVCFNAYIAGKDWAFVPDFDMPEDFHAQERLWYKGALEHPGEVYISEPYLDAASGKMCFSMSTLLKDGETVVAMDFNFSDLQESILKMSADDDRSALIVTRSGRIIGYTDMSLVGEKITQKLPEYEPILERVMDARNHDSFPADLFGRSHMIFSSRTENGWYMILAVDSWALYKENYRQMIFTLVLSLMMLLAIVLFYLNSVKNRILTEQALRVKEEFLARLSLGLREPLHRILKISHVEDAQGDVDSMEKAAEIREAALQLSDMMNNLFSFSTISKTGEKSKAEETIRRFDLPKMSRYTRGGIIAVLAFAVLTSLGICVNYAVNWGDTRMQREADIYNNQMDVWLAKQRSILSMFVNVIVDRPELMEDYEGAVAWLDNIAKSYPEISVCYMTNPYKEHTVIMNNGWTPSADWHVEKRQWYIDTEKSEDGFNVSAPYYDEQTGYYCVTLSQMVYGKNGEFLGIFGIDFYLDRLIHVLGESYSKNGYAFLVDPKGIILNHPNSAYQMTTTSTVNIHDTEYRSVYLSGEVDTFRDYNGTFVSCLAQKSSASGFTVVVANRWWNIYGGIVLIATLFFLLLSFAIATVAILINRLLRWQQYVHRELREAADTAMAAGRAKSQFLAQMSHEIRTPINAVLGMNEMILRESKDRDILDYAASIQSAGRTLLTLINSILDFSKIEDGKMEIVPVRYELLPLMVELSAMVAERAKKKGLTLKTEIDADLPKVLFGDDVRIRQIVTNLLSNAVKYTHEGTVTLVMKGEPKDEDTMILAVSVKDTGIGIREEDMDKLFQSFQRLDEEKNRNIEGTGLGISIVQKLLAMMGSQLSVTSTYGQGSTFSFRLEQKIIDHAPIGDFAEYAGHHRDSAAKNEKHLKAPEAKILVVDDTSMNLKVVRGLLKRSGIVPDLAESGKDCLSLAAKKSYHIIFLDHMMPEMDGIETLRQLKEGKHLGAGTVVIVLTANAITNARDEYLAAGFDDYLSKPIDAEELETIIAKYLPKDLVSYEGEEVPSLPPAEEKEPSAEKEPEAEKEPLNEDEDTFSEEELSSLADLCPMLDASVGLDNCMGLKSLYIDVLKDYQKDERMEKIEALYEKQDVKGYRIAVHALKGTSGTLGALALAEKAKAQEMAAKAEDWEAVTQSHQSLMEDYRELCLGLREWLKDHG